MAAIAGAEVGAKPSSSRLKGFTGRLCPAREWYSNSTLKPMGSLTYTAYQSFFSGVGLVLFGWIPASMQRWMS